MRLALLLAVLLSPAAFAVGEAPPAAPPAAASGTPGASGASAPSPTPGSPGQGGSPTTTGPVAPAEPRYLERTLKMNGVEKKVRVTEDDLFNSYRHSESLREQARQVGETRKQYEQRMQALEEDEQQDRKSTRLNS